MYQIEDQKQKPRSSLISDLFLISSFDEEQIQSFCGSGTMLEKQAKGEDKNKEIVIEEYISFK